MKLLEKTLKRIKNYKDSRSQHIMLNGEYSTITNASKTIEYKRILLHKMSNMLISSIYENQHLYPDTESRVAVALSLLQDARTITIDNFLHVRNDLKTISHEKYIKKYKNPAERIIAIKAELSILEHDFLPEDDTQTVIDIQDNIVFD